MATLVRCIEGHAFDPAASETCPICGSAVFKKEPGVENKRPRNVIDAKRLVEFASTLVGSIKKTAAENKSSFNFKQAGLALVAGVMIGAIFLALLLTAHIVWNSKVGIAIAGTAELVMHPPCGFRDRDLISRLGAAPSAYRRGEKPCSH